MRRRRSFAVLPMLVAVLGAGCHRPARTVPAPEPSSERYCWWTVFRTTLPPDTVAIHFERAFTALGLHDAKWTHLADTAWAQAVPTRLDGSWGGGMYAARVVAYRQGDGTRFRHFVAITPPPEGWAASLDSVTGDGRHVSISPSGNHIGFCQALGRAAQVHATAPREPSGEESLEVWRRIPTVHQGSQPGP